MFYTKTANGDTNVTMFLMALNLQLSWKRPALKINVLMDTFKKEANHEMNGNDLLANPMILEGKVIDIDRQYDAYCHTISMTLKMKGDSAK